MKINNYEPPAAEELRFVSGGPLLGSFDKDGGMEDMQGSLDDSWDA